MSNELFASSDERPSVAVRRRENLIRPISRGKKGRKEGGREGKRKEWERGKEKR